MKNSIFYSSLLNRYLTQDEFDLVNKSVKYLTGDLNKNWDKMKKKEQYILLGVAMGSQLILESVVKGEAEDILEQTKRGLGLIVETEDTDE